MELRRFSITLKSVHHQMAEEWSASCSYLICHSNTCKNQTDHSRRQETTVNLTKWEPQSQLPRNCCTYYAATDLEDSPGRMRRSGSHSLGMNHSTFITLTRCHVNILVINGPCLPGTSAEPHSGPFYWWHHVSWSWEAESSFVRNALVRHIIKMQDPAKLMMFLEFQKFVTC